MDRPRHGNNCAARAAARRLLARRWRHRAVAVEAKLERTRRAADDARLESEETNLELETLVRRARILAHSAEISRATKAQLIDSLPAILVGLDDEDRIMEWNRVAEQLLGVAGAVAVGSRLVDIKAGWDAETVAGVVSRCREEKAQIEVEDVRFSGPRGDKGYLNMIASPVAVGDGEFGGTLIIATDQSDRKQLECELRQADKMRAIGNLSAGIAHEINTPTQYVGDNCRFLKDAFDDVIRLVGAYESLISAAGQCRSDPDTGVESPGGQRGGALAIADEIDLDFLRDEIPQAIGQCLEGVNRVSEIVKGMKEFAHPDTGAKAPADINRLIESTVAVSRNEWKYVAELETEFDASLPEVPCLRGEFNQVVLNLIVNASHAIADAVADTDQKGRITVSTRRDGDWAVVRVSDTGTGIPDEHRARVFDPFFTTKGVGKGTGQGLAIAYSVITEKHGGSIDFNTKPGRGTEFVIRLPLVPDTETVPEENPTCVS